MKLRKFWTIGGGAPYRSATDRCVQSLCVTSQEKQAVSEVAVRWRIQHHHTGSGRDADNTGRAGDAGESGAATCIHHQTNSALWGAAAVAPSGGRSGKRTDQKQTRTVRLRNIGFVYNVE